MFFLINTKFYFSTKNKDQTMKPSSVRAKNNFLFKTQSTEEY